MCSSDLTRIRSGENLDEPAFGEGTLTYRQLQRIDQQHNPQLYTEVSLLEDTDYQPPHYQGNQSEDEEEEEGVTQAEEEPVEEHPLPIPEPSGIHLWTPLICLGRNKDLCSRRSKYKPYGALRGCDLGVRDCLQVYCGK